MKVCILQTDNRPTLDYLLLTQIVNKQWCKQFNYEYMFVEIDNSYTFFTKQYAKLYVMNKILQEAAYDIIVFLDSDAWIQNGSSLNDLINKLNLNSEKHGCFSRDPYFIKNTFVNSGSFMLKVNEYTTHMYRTIINNFEKDLKECEGDDRLVRNKNKGWCDQFYISSYVFNNRDAFYIFVPDYLNTPMGKVIRHNWCKNQKMFDDLNTLIQSVKSNMTVLDFTIYIDSKIFPNETDSNYYYHGDEITKA